jgi:hypothetical protein
MLFRYSKKMRSTSWRYSAGISDPGGGGPSKDDYRVSQTISVNRPRGDGGLHTNCVVLLFGAGPSSSSSELLSSSSSSLGLFLAVLGSSEVLVGDDDSPKYQLPSAGRPPETTGGNSGTFSV